MDGKRTAALEVMVKTPRIEQLIAENRDNEIRDAIEEGKEIYGSQSFDQAILDIWKTGKISTQEAFNYATSPSDLKLKMEGLSSVGTGRKQQKDSDVPQFDDDEIFSIKT